MSELTPILYSYWDSSCSWRVRIALAVKNVDYMLKATPVNEATDDLEKIRHQFREVNPIGFVPALVIDNKTLIESVAILEYLEETRPNPPLLPRGPSERADVRKIVQVIVSAIQPLQNRGVLECLTDDKMVWARKYITKGFTAIEKILTETSGRYCVGNSLSMADVCLVPQVFNARRYDVDMAHYPNIVRIDEELQQLPVFQKTHPFKQMDAPEVFPDNLLKLNLKI